MPGVDLEGHVGAGLDDPRQLRQVRGDDVGHRLVVLDPDQRHEVELAGDRVGLGHARDAGERLPQAGDGRAFGLDQDDCRDHVRSIRGSPAENGFMAEIRVGTSGWSYPHWRKRFYPEKLPAREHFTFYAGHFDTVELNNSFYRQPTRERFEAWAGQSPEGFLFAVKGSRYVTHIKRLAVEQESVDRVVEAARGLGDHLGPILFQFQA